jgi:predicted ArsR family transcriptional regulator
MDRKLATDVADVSALAEPARRALYSYVVGESGPVGREQAAAGCGIPVHSAKFHLDRLVDAGLLAVEFRRLSGRTGPGAGRPSKLYRRADRDVSVTLPERRYDLAGSVLAAAVERTLADGVPLQDAIRESAESLGRACVVASSGTTGDGGSADPATSTSTTPDDGVTGEPDREVLRAARALAGLGYEPRTAEGAIRLANCPFDSLAREHTDVVCGMNVSFVGGVLDGLGCDHLAAVLDPDPEMCCVTARRRA